MAAVLVVTGASRGIGAACATLGGLRGYRVCVNYLHNPEKADAVVASIRAQGGEAIAAQADVSSEEDVVSLFKRIDRELGPVTALVNNVGIMLPHGQVADCTAAELERLWRTNVTSQFLCAREAIRRMSTAQGGNGGAIVNVSSVLARLGAPGLFVSYAASKGAIDSFTAGLALEVVDQGIRVNGIRPGIIDTEIHASGGFPDRARDAAAMIPAGRAGTPDEIAETILWLLSEQASYTVGAVIDVSGGR